MTTPGSLPMYPAEGDDRASGGHSDDFAPFGVRLGAYLLDYLVVLALAGAITAALGFHVFALHTRTVHGHQTLTDPGPQLLALRLITTVCTFAYGFAFLSSRWRATPFMKLLGISLARQDDHQPASVARVAARTAVFCAATLIALASFLLSVVVLIDLLWPLWDPRRQTVHDKIAGTVVLRRAAPG